MGDQHPSFDVPRTKPTPQLLPMAAHRSVQKTPSSDVTSYGNKWWDAERSDHPNEVVNPKEGGPVE